jgi:hypothetical protein
MFYIIIIIIIIIIMTERQNNIIRKVYNNNMIAYYRAGLYTSGPDDTRPVYMPHRLQLFFSPYYIILSLLYSRGTQLRLMRARIYYVYTCTHAAASLR